MTTPVSYVGVRPLKTVLRVELGMLHMITLAGNVQVMHEVGLQVVDSPLMVIVDCGVYLSPGGSGVVDTYGVSL